MQEIREELLEGCAGIEPCSGEVPFFSTVTGGLLDAAGLDGEYWYRNLRNPVQFEQATRVLLEGGYRAFLEVSPHPVLTGGVQETVDEVLQQSGDAVVVGSLRRDQGGPERFLRSLSELWVHGVDVDWQALFRGARAKPVKLPTYAFQRERYWLKAAPGAGDMASAGLSSVDHPLLSAVVAMADHRGWVFTGRISLESHPWLADHAVMGGVLLPGTAFLDLALAVGEHVDCGGVRELTLEAPLGFSEGSSVRLQVTVGEPDEDGARSLRIHSRQDDGSVDDTGEGEWIRHASGALVSRGAAVDAVHAGSIQARARLLGADVWPPEGAQFVTVDGIYDLLADRGFDYGPAFQCLRAAWRHGDDLFAEVALSEEQQDEAHAFGVHPALLDAAFHVALSPPVSRNATGQEQKAGGVRLPFSFNGVELYAAGASSLRVSLSPAGNDAISLVVADEAGGLVASVGSLVAREVSAAQLDAAHGARHDSLFHVDWRELPFSPQAADGSVLLLGAKDSPLAEALDETRLPVEVHADLDSLGEALEDRAEPPEIVILDCRVDQAEHGDRAEETGGVERTNGTGGVKSSVLTLMHESAHRVLSVLQGWLADERFVDSRLVLLTRGAVAVAEGEDLAGLAQSSLWGLVRSAQSENPERFLLIDIDDRDASWSALPAALASGESQLALREGTVLVPRLTRAGSPRSGMRESVDARAFNPSGTVLITGGTGTLGGLLARHLVAAHGAGHLLLASRRGEDAEGAHELQAELESLGADVTIAACDVCKRDQLEKLIASIPETHPLSGVVHAAVTLDDGVIGSLTPERLDGVLAVKADAAWYLHELTAHMSLSMFVLFSSAAAEFGSPGQGNYAAANAFLDALAADRRARGLAGTSLAWGLWEEVSGMTAALSETDRARMTRLGMRALASKDGLALFDLALGAGEALLLPVALDLAALRAEARAGALPALFSELMRAPARRVGEQGVSLARRLATTPEQERAGVVLELVRAQVATVLGHSSAGGIDAQCTFKELGFDSLTAVDLRNRLNTQTGLRLPATLIFDHPTPQAVTAYMLEQVAGDGDQIALAQGETAIRRALASIPLARLRQAGLMGTLMELAADGDTDGPAENADIEQIDTLDVAGLIERTLGNHSVDLERPDP